MTKEINALQIIKWLALIVVIITLAWFAFGQSPTFEQLIPITLSGVFMYLAIENKFSADETKHVIKEVHKVVNSQESKFDSLTNALGDIKSSLDKRLPK